MEWRSALRNPESRLDVLKFNQREDLEALQLTSTQWRHNIDRFSPELALRRIQLVEIDLDTGTTFYFNEPNDPRNTLRNCFIEWLRLLAGDGSSTGLVGTDFETRFCVWIKPLQQVAADVHARTLEVVHPSYKVDMDTFYRQLGSAFRVQEYAISRETDIEDEDRGDELRVDVVKKAKRVSILEYHLNGGDEDDEAEDEEEHEDNDVDDKPEMNGFMKNVLDFVFSAPECEELYVNVEGDGSGLINRLIRRFRGLQSTSQMVATFTLKCGLNYEGSNWVEIEECLKPIAVGHVNPFKDVTLERRRCQFYSARDVAVGHLGGDVYEFKNEHDGTYLTVVVSRKHDTVQLRKGPVEQA